MQLTSYTPQIQVTVVALAQRQPRLRHSHCRFDFCWRLIYIYACIVYDIAIERCPVMLLIQYRDYTQVIPNLSHSCAIAGLS